MPTTRPGVTTIRLLMPVRAGKEVLPENAVLDAIDEVADELIGHDPPCAEETDAIERYPTITLLTHVDEFPVTGAEKFPIPPGEELIIPPAMFRTEAQRTAEEGARAEGPILLRKPESPYPTRTPTATAAGPPTAPATAQPNVQVTPQPTSLQPASPVEPKK